MAKVSKQSQEQNKKLVIAKLKPFLQAWVRIKEAVRHYNATHDKELPVAERTIYDWMNQDELFRSKIESLYDYITTIAYNNIAKKIISWDCNLSWKWLETHAKKEFSKDPRFEHVNKPKVNNSLRERLKSIEERKNKSKK